MQIVRNLNSNHITQIAAGHEGTVRRWRGQTRQAGVAIGRGSWAGFSLNENHARPRAYLGPVPKGKHGAVSASNI